MHLDSKLLRTACSTWGRSRLRRSIRSRGNRIWGPGGGAKRRRRSTPTQRQHHPHYLVRAGSPRTDAQPSLPWPLSQGDPPSPLRVQPSGEQTRRLPPLCRRWPSLCERPGETARRGLPRALSEQALRATAATHRDGSRPFFIVTDSALQHETPSRCRAHRSPTRTRPRARRCSAPTTLPCGLASSSRASAAFAAFRSLSASASASGSGRPPGAAPPPLAACH